MKKITAIILISALMLIGCIHEQKPEFDGKDCGNDLNCFEESALQCKKAKVEVTKLIEGIGIAQGSEITVYSEIRGNTEQGCAVYLEIKDIVLPENSSIEEKAIAFAVKGKSMICVSEIYRETLLSITEQDIEKCEGSLVDLIKTGQSIVTN